MSRLSQNVIVQSYPRPQDFPLRAAIITADHGNGTVDVCVFNSQESIREASMPLSQSLGNIPLIHEGAEMPTDYRGRWLAIFSAAAVVTFKEHFSDDDLKLIQNTKDGEVVKLGGVAKPKSGNKPSR